MMEMFQNFSYLNNVSNHSLFCKQIEKSSKNHQSIPLCRYFQTIYKNNILIVTLEIRHIDHLAVAEN